jgi:hypothetical protein
MALVLIGAMLEKLMLSEADCAGSISQGLNTPADIVQQNIAESTIKKAAAAAFRCKVL